MLDKWSKLITATISAAREAGRRSTKIDPSHEENAQKLAADANKDVTEEEVKAKFTEVFDEDTKDGPTTGTPERPDIYADTYWPNPGSWSKRFSKNYNYIKKFVMDSLENAMANCYNEEYNGYTAGPKHKQESFSREAVRRAYGVPNPAKKVEHQTATEADLEQGVMVFYCALGIVVQDETIPGYGYTFQILLDHWFMERFYNYAVEGYHSFSPSANTMDYPWLKYKHDVISHAHPSALQGMAKLHKLLNERVRRVANHV